MAATPTHVREQRVWAWFWSATRHRGSPERSHEMDDFHAGPDRIVGLGGSTITRVATVKVRETVAGSSAARICVVPADSFVVAALAILCVASFR